ncbi:MAG: hypothetical protein IIA82_03850 [Thaumarchaeota archaeon]|nr:hypothetical protein [Nitrososphaerota archaeon]
MNKFADDEIIESLNEHPFSTLQQIKSTGAIKNHTSLKKRLDSLEDQNKITHLKFISKYYVNPLSDYLVILGTIEECADRILSQLKNNQNLKQGSFYKEIKKTSKFNNCTGTKISRAKRFVKDLSDKKGNIKEPNERYLMKYFLLFELRAIIWNLEFRKLQQLSFAANDDQKLINSMFIPLWFFENFLKNYDPKNSKYILGTSYETLEKSLDQMYFDDMSYYNLLKSQKDSLYTKIMYCSEYLLNDNKKDVSEFYHAKKKQMIGFEERIKKNLDKERDQHIEDRFEPVLTELTSKMKVEKKKAKNDKSKQVIQEKFEVLSKKKKQIIKENDTIKYQKKFEKERSRITPKNTKSITHMMNSFHNRKGMLDFEQLFHQQRIEYNRLFCDNVNNSVLELFLILHTIRFIVNQIPRHEPDYKKIKKVIKKTLPEFVMA